MLLQQIYVVFPVLVKYFGVVLVFQYFKSIGVLVTSLMIVMVILGGHGGGLLVNKSPLPFPPNGNGTVVHDERGECVC